MPPSPKPWAAAASASRIRRNSPAPCAKALPSATGPPSSTWPSRAMREKCCPRSTAERSRSKMATGLPDVAGKVAIVTGAAGGLGLAIAERLASDGAALVLADIDLTGAEAARDTVPVRCARAPAQRTDVSDQKDVAALVERKR